LEQPHPTYLEPQKFLPPSIYPGKDFYPSTAGFWVHLRKRPLFHSRFSLLHYSEPPTPDDAPRKCLCTQMVTLEAGDFSPRTIVPHLQLTPLSIWNGSVAEAEFSSYLGPFGDGSQGSLAVMRLAIRTSTLTTTPFFFPIRDSTRFFPCVLPQASCSPTPLTSFFCLKPPVSLYRISPPPVISFHTLFFDSNHLFFLPPPLSVRLPFSSPICMNPRKCSPPPTHVPQIDHGPPVPSLPDSTNIALFFWSRPPEDGLPT